VKRIKQTFLKSSVFKAEKTRQFLATQKKLVALRKMYSRKLPELKNLNTGKFWDKIFEESKNVERYDAMTRNRMLIVLDMIPIVTATILDIGMGLGLVERHILKSGRSIHLFGNDISKKAMDNAKKNLKGDFKQESWEKMTHSASKFDTILLLEILEHVPPSKTFKLLNKIHRYLKKRGTLILSIPVNEGLESMDSNPNGHMRIYTKDLIVAELKIAGFKSVLVKELYAFKKYYKFKKLITKIYKNRWKPNVLVIKAIKI